MIDRTTGILIFIIVLLLISPLINLLRWIWRFLVTLCMTNSIDLKEKFGDWAVITGSTDGIGKEYAKELVKRNINIVLISRNMEKLKNVKDEIAMLNPDVQIKIIQADFSRGKEEIDKIEDQLRNISVGILVNNVGIVTEYPLYFDEISKSEVWDFININVAAAVLMTRLVIEQMKDRRQGAIVNVSSGAEMTPIPLLSVYAASKIYLRYFSDALRAEYSKYGLTVQCLAPYYVNTKMVAYSERIQSHNILCPSASTYAKNAIETLGVLDSATGYWAHEIIYFLISITPKWLRIQSFFVVNRVGRSDHFAAQKKKGSVQVFQI